MAAQATQFTFVNYNGPLVVDANQPSGPPSSPPAATAPEGYAYNKRGELVKRTPHRPYEGRREYGVRITKVTEDQLRIIRPGYDLMPLPIFKNKPQGAGAQVRLLDEEIGRLESLLQKRLSPAGMKNPDKAKREGAQMRMKLMLDMKRKGLNVYSKEAREKLALAGLNGGDLQKLAQAGLTQAGLNGGDLQ